ncbi:MAG: DUF4270 domain-containing protein [Flavobacteriales bacterium]|nr:DUF4270 domain-containing protein [Flavobacteriales bacterium]
MKILYPFFVTVFVSAFLFSCTKNKTLGKDVIDPSSYLNGVTVDTFDLITYTIAEDSSITDNASNVVLGSYIDPKFGEFDASFYSQVRLGGLSPDFGNPSSIKIDSFVLALKYVGYYGDLSAQTFEVYELDDTLNLNSTYYSFTTKNVKSTNWVPSGKGTISPKPLTKTVIGDDTVDAQLRIPLDTNIARNFIEEATSGSSTFTSNDDFLNYFKGIKVKTNNLSQSTGQGAIFYFNITDAASKMTIYFTQGNAQKTFDFVINSDCADFTNVQISNSGKPIDLVLQDSTKGLTEFYAQAFKHRAIVKIKNIENLPKNLVIHRADLTLPVQYQTGYRYKPGSSVSIATKLKSTDVNYTSLGILGEFNEAKKYFSINLRTYVQALVNKEIENNGVVVSPRFFINSSERIIFNGKNTTNKTKPKLILTYTTY